MGIARPVNDIHSYRTLTMNVTDATGPTLLALTEIIDLKGWRPCGLFMPATWTAAGLHFLGSSNSKTAVVPIYDEAGEVVIVSGSVAASTYLAFTSTAVALEVCQFFQIGSGTNGTPVAQGAARTLILSLLPAD